VDTDQNLGEAEPRLSDADDDLNDFDSQQQREETACSLQMQYLRPGEEQDCRPEGYVRRPAVQVLQQLRVEAVPRGSTVASVRPRARRQHSDKDGDGERDGREGGERSVPHWQRDG